jgi:hypothetical protein
VTSVTSPLVRRRDDRGACEEIGLVVRRTRGVSGGVGLLAQQFELELVECVVDRWQLVVVIILGGNDADDRFGVRERLQRCHPHVV